MQYGLVVFPTSYSLQPDELARLAEERGFESIWFPEHTHIPASRRTPWPGGPNMPREYSQSYDPYVALTAAACATRDIKVGTGITLIPEHDPITLAKTVATLDQISNGRFILGIGGGWNVEEAEDHGIAFAKRFPILRERVLAMIELWTKEEAEFHGRYVDFDKAWSFPKPVQQPHPPVLMGGNGATTFDRIVEFGDGWFPISRGGPPPNFKERVTELKQKASAAGRDPESISVSLYGAPPDAELLKTLESQGLQRAVLLLPSEPQAETRRVMDDYARLIG